MLGVYNWQLQCGQGQACRTMNLIYESSADAPPVLGGTVYSV
jgi:hypothetical protein